MNICNNITDLNEKVFLGINLFKQYKKGHIYIIFPFYTTISITVKHDFLNPSMFRKISLLNMMTSKNL